MQKNGCNAMGSAPVPGLVIRMSLPIILSMLVQAMYNIVDSIFVSRISEAALTAVSLSFPAQNLMIGLAGGTAVGVNALVSRALGADDREYANRVAENGVLLALVGYGIFLIFGLAGSRAFLAAQTSDARIIQYGVDYLMVVSCFSFGIFGQMLFDRLIQSTGRTKYTMLTQGVGAVINIILDPIFIFTLGMGVGGAAAATVIGQIVACVMAVIINRKKNPDLKLTLKRFRPNPVIIGRIYAIGIPSALMVAVGSVMTFLMNVILIVYTAGRETTATVFGVYFKLNSFVFMPVFGLNNGMVPIIAYNYGAKNVLRMKQAIRYSMKCAVCIMTFGMIIFEAIPLQLLALFDATEPMLEIGAPALRIIGATFPVAAICIVLNAVYQAFGLSIYSMLISLVRQMLVLVPAAWLLAMLGGRIGNDHLVWLAFPFAEVFSVSATMVFYRKLKKNVIDKIPIGQ